MSSTFLLLHGHYLGSWCWDLVRPSLEAAGHAVVAPQLHGMGELFGALDESSGLERHCRDVTDLILQLDLRDLVLVGHSYSGLVACGVAHTSRSRIRRVVFLDGAVASHGQRLFDLIPGAEQSMREAADANGGLAVPLAEPLALTLAAAGLESAESQARWGSRMTAVPLRTLTDRLEAPGDPVHLCAPHYIRCTRFPMSAETAATCRVRPGWTYDELPTGHLPMLTEPELTAAALLRAAETSR